ncbi:MAG: hypothetical protein IT500_08115 [Rubrivivax sp.]|nr:hypothetical protein [Rubrivivax sp.]
MAEVTSIGKDPVIVERSEREKAIGTVMSDVADLCRTIGFLSLAAIEHGDTEQGASMSEAAMVLAGLAGALADRASRATGEAGTMTDDEWLFSPRTQAALKLLEGGAAAA